MSVFKLHAVDASTVVSTGEIDTTDFWHVSIRYNADDGILAYKTYLSIYFLHTQVKPFPITGVPINL